MLTAAKREGAEDGRQGSDGKLRSLDSMLMALGSH